MGSGPEGIKDVEAFAQLYGELCGRYYHSGCNDPDVFLDYIASPNEASRLIDGMSVFNPTWDRRELIDMGLIYLVRMESALASALKREEQML